MNDGDMHPQDSNPDANETRATRKIRKDSHQALIILFLSVWAFASWWIFEWVLNQAWYYFVGYLFVTILLFYWGWRNSGIDIGPAFPALTTWREKRRKNRANNS